MKRSHSLGLMALLAAGLLNSGVVRAADAPVAHRPAASASAGAELAEAEVRKIDREAGKITLKHGEIRNLDMPPMTMVFQVRDRALLDALQVGMQVRFKALHEAGKFVVTDLEVKR